MKVTFLGAAKCVTGSCYYIRLGDKKFLVDCGLFQGPKSLRERNYDDFDFNPAEIDFVLLTHAHIDHSGRIPKLFKKGFQGVIYATPPTVQLCSIMLPDAGHIQEMEVERKNKKLARQGKPLLEPIYTAADGHNCMTNFKRIDYDNKVELSENLKVCFRNAGHILGSAMIELFVTENGQEAKFLFSGDLGNKNQPIVKDPYNEEEMDYLIIESTYGNREHPVRDRTENRRQLKEVILKALAKGGNIIVPSFAVERTQDFLLDLNILLRNNEIPEFPIFIDSPLAISATEIFQKNQQYFDDTARELNMDGQQAIILPNVQFSKTVDESRELNQIKKGVMIISASGMCDAGRIKHHLKYNLWRSECTVLFIGYQAEGTLGRRIVDGEKIVRIHGESIQVAADIVFMEGFSGHIDKKGMLEWISDIKKKPKQIILVHGEPSQIDALESNIHENFEVETFVPEYLDEVVFLSEQKEKVKILEEKKIKFHQEDLQDHYFNVYRAVRRNLKELMKLRKNEDDIDQLTKDLQLIEDISRRFLKS